MISEKHFYCIGLKSNRLYGIIILTTLKVVRLLPMSGQEIFDTYLNKKEIVK